MKTIKELCIAFFHPGPLITLFLIKTITITAAYCTIMWWPPASSLSGLLWLVLFFSLSGSTLYNFLASMSVGPGSVPKGWQPEVESDVQKVQYCNNCESYKPPRAHHCRKCKSCVLKMDHHCPWINSCVGHDNHTHFIAFLVSAIMGCSQATVTVACSLYHSLYRGYYIHYRIRDAPMVYLGDTAALIWCLYILGCAFGVSVGVGVLFYYQVKGILRNRTVIEEWILEKAQYRRAENSELPPYVHPYDFGWKTNLSQVINFKCETVGDGIVWPVVSSCNQYTLTMEQIAQKRDKQMRTQEVVAVDDYSGHWFPVVHGFRVFIHPPCSEESRMALEEGDRVLVSRWQKYWLYGEKIQREGTNLREIKGWFPRICVSLRRGHRPTCKNYRKPAEAIDCTGASLNAVESSIDSVVEVNNSVSKKNK